MSESRVCYCMSCGAPLSVMMNRKFVFCQFCGAKNIITSQHLFDSIRNLQEMAHNQSAAKDSFPFGY